MTGTEDAVVSTNQPDPANETDQAVRDVLDYLALERLVEGELSSLEAAVRRVLLAMLVLEESAGSLTPYRQNVLREMRKSGDPAAGSRTTQQS
jgi:hypothetical protein